MARWRRRRCDAISALFRGKHHGNMKENKENNKKAHEKMKENHETNKKTMETHEEKPWESEGKGMKK